MSRALGFLVFVLSALGVQALPAQGVFSRTNLVAWCIVPFDSQKRGPEARAEMLEQLGFTRLAYDWRAEHLPTFDAEVEAMRRRRIEITAWWFPAALNAEAKAILACIERQRIHPQLWITLGTEPEPDAARLEQKIQSAVGTLGPICAEAARLGCTVALYNHLGWFGEPANQVRVIEGLRKAGHRNVGSVYNFHHGHGHLDDFERQFAILKPHLLALNLNGMVRDGDKAGKKILPLGQGDQEARLLKIVQASGWRGPVGLIGHTDEDAAVKLRKELDGLEKLTAAAGGTAGEPPASGREPGVQAEKDWVDNRWQRTDIGPFLASTVRLPDGGTVVRGLTVRVGPEACALYDLAQGSVRAVWTGGFLTFDATRFGLIGTPVPAGKVLWTADPVRPKDAPLPRFLGQHHTPGGIVLDWEVGGVRVRERPDWVATPAGPALVRHLEVGARSAPLRWWSAGHLNGDGLSNDTFQDRSIQTVQGVPSATVDTLRHTHLVRNIDAGTMSVAAVVTGVGIDCEAGLRREAAGVGRGSALLKLPVGGAMALDVVLWRGGVGEGTTFERWAKARPLPAVGAAPIPAAPGVPELVTRGQRGLETGPFAVDTLTLPYDNPYQALLFASGVDFTSDGAGHVCTIHGDVWRVTGIDEGLQSLRWKRVASGLFQPLGLKVRDNQVYVLGKDRITRLEDTNGDGVTDFYATFYDGIATSPGGHDYVTCLEVDSQGRFHYADPQGVHRVAADGRSARTIASGFRNPNGMRDRRGPGRGLVRLRRPQGRPQPTPRPRLAPLLDPARRGQLQRIPGVDPCGPVGRPWWPDGPPALGALRDDARAARRPGPGAPRRGGAVAGEVPQRPQPGDIPCPGGRLVRRRQHGLADQRGEGRGPAARPADVEAAARPRGVAAGRRRLGVHLRREARPGARGRSRELRGAPVELSLFPGLRVQGLVAGQSRQGGTGRGRGHLGRPAARWADRPDHVGGRTAGHAVRAALRRRFARAAVVQPARALSAVPGCPGVSVRRRPWARRPPRGTRPSAVRGAGDGPCRARRRSPAPQARSGRSPAARGCPRARCCRL